MTAESRTERTVAPIFRPGTIARSPQRPDAGAWITLVCLAVVGLAVAVPTVVLLHDSFVVRGSAGSAAYSVLNYIKVLSSEETYRLLWTTLSFACAMAAFSGVLGFLFAWLAARTNIAARRFMPLAVLLPYLIPTSLGAIGWILLLSPTNGILNLWAEALFGGGPLFNIYSFWGMVFVETMYTFPLSFMFFYAALSSSNATLEEASAACGAGVFQTLFRITVPTMWPTIISVATLLFIIGLESFDVARFIGYPARVYVLSIQIYVLTHVEYPTDFAAASVYGVIALVGALALVALYRSVTRESAKFVSISGKNFRNEPFDLGAWRIPAAVLFYSVVAIIGVIPTLLLLALSFNAVSWPFALSGDLSLQNYAWIISDSAALRSFVNTLLLASFGATLTIVLTFFVAYATVRIRKPGHTALDYLAFVPFAFPGTVLAVGLIEGFIRTPIYNTIWIMVIAFVIKFLPYGLRNVSGSMLQIHRELEEASLASGAGILVTLRRVVLPLALPGIISGWSLLFIVFMRQFTLPAMLSSPGSQVATIVLFQEWEAGQVGHVAAVGCAIMALCVPFLVIARRLAGLRSI